MIEDINCILNTGTVTDLPYNKEEIKNINEICKIICQRKGILPNKININ